MQVNIFFGRLSRREYFYGLAVYFFIILLPASAYAVSIAEPGATPAMIQAGARSQIIVAQILFVIVMLGLSARRLHDINKPVWLIVLAIIPPINFIFQLYLLFVPSVKEPNEFGPVGQKHSRLEILGLWRIEDKKINE